LRFNSVLKETDLLVSRPFWKRVAGHGSKPRIPRPRRNGRVQKGANIRDFWHNKRWWVWDSDTVFLTDGGMEAIGSVAGAFGLFAFVPGLNVFPIVLSFRLTHSLPPFVWFFLRLGTLSMTGISLKFFGFFLPI
jgi:hypothetical protein